MLGVCQFGCYTLTTPIAYKFYDLIMIITDAFYQVVLVANSLPALNDVTAMELPDIVAEAAKVCVFSYALSFSVISIRC